MTTHFCYVLWWFLSWWSLADSQFWYFSWNYFLNDEVSSKGGKIKRYFILILCTSLMYGSQYLIQLRLQGFLRRKFVNTVKLWMPRKYGLQVYYWYTVEHIFFTAKLRRSAIFVSKLIPFKNQLLICNRKTIIWASSWGYGTYHIGDQRRLRRACGSAQSHQSLRSSHTWSMEIVEESDQKSDILPHWMTAHARLKNEFTEDKKNHNLMTWLILPCSVDVWHRCTQVSFFFLS